MFGGDQDIIINDNNGKNTLVLDSIKNFFVDVTLGDRDTYYIDDEITFNGINGHQLIYIGKDAKSITTVVVDNGVDPAVQYKFDVEKLANDVASWMSVSGYAAGTSASDIMADAGDPLHDAFVAVYNSKINDCYQQMA